MVRLGVQRVVVAVPMCRLGVQPTLCKDTKYKMKIQAFKCKFS